MKMKYKKIKLLFGFVPMGQVAPDPIPPGEVWLDVGNRVAPRILDHHGGDTSAWSASQLVFEKIDEFILPYIEDFVTIRIILHIQPDLDAICAAWLVKKRAVERMDLKSVREIQSIIQSVNENDQGLVKTNIAISCWPIIMRSLIGCVPRDEIDDIVINSWFALFDETLKILGASGSFADVAEKIITPKLRVILAQDQKDYDYDVQRGLIFQVMLPLQNQFSLKINCGAPIKEDERRVLCDALFLHNPSSLLFKELSRGDIKNSMQESGFPLLVISWDIQTNDGRVFQRYIISTDPFTGFHLRGLGSLLEKQEQKKEDQLGLPYLPGRERVESGKGRFGWNVVSPWYDGRGHSFSIVDSPSIQIDEGICASQLNSNEVLEVLWAYGDPALFIRVMDAQATCLYSSFPSLPLNRSEGSSTLHDLLIGSTNPLCSWSSEMLQLANDVVIQDLSEKTPAENQKCSLKQQIWGFFTDTLISIRCAKLSPRVYTLYEVTCILERMRNSGWLSLPLKGGSLSAFSSPTFLINLIVNAVDLSFSRKSPALELALCRLAAGRGAGFPQKGEYENCSSLHSIMTVDGWSQLAAIPNGYVFINSSQPHYSESNTPIDNSEIQECLIPVLALALSIKSKISNLSEQFFRHIHCQRASKLEKLLLEDREKLFWFEHTTQIQRVCELPFVQKIFEFLKSHMEIPERFLQASKQINNLADAMKEARANLLSKISFLLTTAVSPLLLTLSFFGGRFLDKEFKERYKLFLPEKWLLWISQHLGLDYNWVSFLMILLALYMILLSFWVILGRKHRKKIKKARVFKFLSRKRTY